MKKLFFAVLLCGVSLLANAQDSTFVPHNGFRVAADVGLLPNASLQTIQEQFRQAGINPAGIRSFLTGITMALVRDRPNSIRESRLLFVNTPDSDPATASSTRRSTFYGYGVGLTYTIKVVNTPRFIVGPVLGYDFMWYRLRILPQNPQSLSLGTVAANPGQYSTVTLRQGFYVNVSGGVGADYRTSWLRRYYSECRLGGRVGYQLPLIRGRRWRYDDGVVDDIAGFRSNNLFAQVSVTFLGRKRSRY